MADIRLLLAFRKHHSLSVESSLPILLDASILSAALQIGTPGQTIFPFKLGTTIVTHVSWTQDYDVCGCCSRCGKASREKAGKERVLQRNAFQGHPAASSQQPAAAHLSCYSNEGRCDLALDLFHCHVVFKDEFGVFRCEKVCFEAIINVQGLQ